LEEVKGKISRDECKSRWKYNRTDPKQTGVKCRYGWSELNRVRMGSENLFLWTRYWTHRYQNGRGLLELKGSL